jgi:hypothetical protein
LADVRAMAVKQWLDKLPFGVASKARARNMLSKLMDLPMLWEYIPVGRNPMELVRVKGSTRRRKEIVILTPDQFKALVETGRAIRFNRACIRASGPPCSETLSVKSGA